MPANPTITAALRAASEAAMEAIGWEDDGSMDFEPADVARDAAAAAIAAFLRALPDDPRGDVAPILLHGQGERIATAVEEAARDA